MAQVIYFLCALTALLCSGLLLRAYARLGHRILLWSGLHFAGLVVSNLLLILDRIVFPSMDLSTLRLACALLALMPLLYGLVWEED